MNENKLGQERRPNQLLRGTRERHGWTREDVARLIELPDPRNLGRWERGVSVPSLYYQRKLCSLFEMSAVELGFLSDNRAQQKQQAVPAPGEALKNEPLWKIPPTFTSFIGREQEASAICDLLRQEDLRLITLLGPGGIGKTRLSIRVAEEMRSTFVDGVCFISLASVLDHALVMPTIAVALNIQQSVAMPQFELVKRMLAEKHFLLVLDNFEQVISAASSLEDLLAACPFVKVVMTSRAALHLQAERVFTVCPLLLPDIKRIPEPQILGALPSVALFVQRARAVRRDFYMTPANAHAIAECCVHLDGLPLAIELAAARINLFTPQSLLARLSQRLHLLKSGAYPPRQQTLYNTMKWSYDLLNEQERWLFRQLGVFQGDWTLETCEQIFGNKLPEDFTIVDTIESLLNKSLLQRVDNDDVERRFTMLETVRTFALDCLHASEEINESQRRYARYYLALVEEAAPHLKSAHQAEWLTRLEREMENLRAALTWFIECNETELALRFCDAFGKFCGLRGYWSEEQRWFSVVLALPGEPSIMRARILRRAGYLAYRLRNLADARSWQEESVQLSRVLGDSFNLAGALGGLAWTIVRQKDTTLSPLRLLEESVEMARASGDQWSLANALESLGRFKYRQGELEPAYRLVGEGVERIRAVEDKESLVRFLLTLVSIELARGNIARAEELAQESFVLAQELDTLPLKALVLECLGIVVLKQGHYEQAAHLLAQRLTFARELGDVSAIAKNQLLLADIALAQEDLEGASAYVQDSLHFFRLHGDGVNIALALDRAGAIKLAQNAPEAAWECYREALSLDRIGGDKKNVGQHLVGLALVMLAQQLYEDAVCLFSAATAWIWPTIDMHPQQRKEHDRALLLARTQLGVTRFEDAWHRGARMTLQQILSWQNL